MMHSKARPFEGMLAAKVEYECKMRGAQQMGWAFLYIRWLSLLCNLITPDYFVYCLLLITYKASARVTQKFINTENSMEVQQSLVFTINEIIFLLIFSLYRFNPVVGSGPNGSVIHYSRNNKQVNSFTNCHLIACVISCFLISIMCCRLKMDIFILMDIGCELHGYLNDLTRTWPPCGRFSSAQVSMVWFLLEIISRYLGDHRAHLLWENILFSFLVFTFNYKVDTLFSIWFMYVCQLLLYLLLGWPFIWPHKFLLLCMCRIK